VETDPPGGAARKDDSRLRHQGTLTAKERIALHASVDLPQPDSYDRLPCPIFLDHGNEDATVPPSSTRAWRDETDRSCGEVSRPHTF